MSRARIAVTVMLAITLATGSAAAAARPTVLPLAFSGDDAVITFTGTATNQPTEGNPTTGTSIITVDCSANECLVTISVTNTGSAYDLLRGQSVLVTDGRGSFTLPASGNVCDRTYEGSATGTVELTRSSVTITMPYQGSELVECSSSSSTQYEPGIITLTASLASGDPCHVFDDCAPPELIAAPSADPDPAAVLPSPSSRGVDDPSILSTLPTAAEAVTARGALWATAMAIILVLLLTLPTYLLNSAIKRGTDRFDDWALNLSARTGKLSHRIGKAAGRLATLTGWKACALGIVAASVISSLIDPELGFNAASLRTVLSILASLTVKITAGWLLVVWVVRRTHPTATPKFEFRPLTLLAVVIAVVLTRVTGFEPGIIFGLVAGLTFGSLLATAEKARVALIGLGLGFGISLLAWLGYSILTTIDNPGTVLLFVIETLSSAAIAGIVALPIALIPAPGMTGNIVWNWSRRIWAAAYLIGLVGFFLILMPMPFSWTEVPLSLTVWIGLFVAYLIVAIAVWLIIIRPWRRVPEAQSVSETVKPAERIDAD